MEWFEALILGIIQGLTEYLPISSSGHLVIVQNLFGLTNPDDILTFTVLLHVATVLSTVLILWKEIVWIFKDIFSHQRWNSYSGLNDGTRYAINIIISMIPVGVVGLLFKDKVEAFFGDGLLIVGICLLVTASLLAFAYFAKHAGKRCLIIDKRSHLGGNVYCENIEGINVHKYGAHIFHTSNKEVWDFVNQFVHFNNYRHVVKSRYNDKAPRSANFWAPSPASGACMSICLIF